ncbi:class I SAM-dependent methyltransferase [Candidatus Gracilibacteria bacterium]|nr:class I SAM-dependent methyltransferase [Candidatus Gracilibacteria bacterium]
MGLPRRGGAPAATRWQLAGHGHWRGEFLSSLAPLPADTWATESYRPNVPLAEARLAPLGVRVIAFDEDSQLPLPDGRFDMVINRHESFSAHEVRRVLRPGGLFLTQQVGGRDNVELNEALQEDVALSYEQWSAASAAEEIRAAGLEVLDEREAISKGHFTDLGAVLIYLRFAPWQIEGFSPQAFRTQLVRLHQRIQVAGGLTTGVHRFLLIARRQLKSARGTSAAKTRSLSGWSGRAKRPPAGGSGGLALLGECRAQRLQVARAERR